MRNIKMKKVVNKSSTRKHKLSELHPEIEYASVEDFPMKSPQVREIILKNAEVRFNHYHKLGEVQLHNRNYYRQKSTEFPSTSPVYYAYPLNLNLSETKKQYLQELEFKFCNVMIEEVELLMNNCIAELSL